MGKAHLKDVLGTLLLGERDLAVVNDDSVTVGTTLIVSPANALGELGLRVRQEENVVAGDAVDLAPSAHDVRIVVGENGDNINTLGPQGGEVINVSGDVGGRADGGEGTWRRIRTELSSTKR